MHRVAEKRKGLSLHLKSVLVALIAINLPVTVSTRVYAETTERARYNQPEQRSALRFTPIDLANGSKLTMIAPQRWSETADTLIRTLYSTHDQFTDIFSEIPPFSTSIRLMDEGEFFALTGAPSWTNAMFFKGEIILPLVPEKRIDLENLNRSVRHEYTHAILAALTSGALPGWIDEGLAQWFEGEEMPGLRSALRDWLKSHEPVPLKLLQGGFTKLDPAMVPAAYAQSLIGARLIADTYGFTAISNYFLLLRQGVERDAAFATAFGISTRDFEKHLGGALKRWAAKE